MKGTMSLILGGGQGSRLYPLTKDRSKPAVPIGGKFRLIDIPITNCLRSNLNRIFKVTQFNSESLNKHISQTYRFDNYHHGFVNLLAAEQTITSRDWYQGTADAVRKNLKHILAYNDVKHVLILSGDQIYNMNFKKLIKYHKTNGFELTISVIPVHEGKAHSFGIMKVNKNAEILKFVEKPKEIDLLKQCESRDFIRKNYPEIPENKDYLASMGIYLFNVETLIKALDNTFSDFGKEIIPDVISKNKVGAYFFNGYWEDVGLIKTFLEANLDFTNKKPKFDLYKQMLYTHARFLPPSKIYNCKINQAMVCEGSIINGAEIKTSIIGIRSIIKKNVKIENSLIMGADYYEKKVDMEMNRIKNVLNIGIGENCIIKNAIIDKNVRIGKNCKIINKENIKNFESEKYFIKDYIVIIPKNTILEDNTVI